MSDDLSILYDILQQTSHCYNHKVWVTESLIYSFEQVDNDIAKHHLQHVLD
jgi:hypothetical protein